MAANGETRGPGLRQMPGPCVSSLLAKGTSSPDPGPGPQGLGAALVAVSSVPEPASLGHSGQLWGALVLFLSTDRTVSPCKPQDRVPPARGLADLVPPFGGSPQESWAHLSPAPGPLGPGTPAPPR